MIRKRRNRHYNPWEKRRKKTEIQKKAPLNKSGIPVTTRTRTIATYKQSVEYYIEQYRDSEAFIHIHRMLARNLGYGLAEKGFITFTESSLGAGRMKTDASVDVIVP